MNDLPELLDQYFSLGVAEGKEGRDHDTPDGEAQATRDLIDQKIMRLRRESAEARKAAFIEAAEMSDDYPLHSDDRLSPGSEANAFVSGQEFAAAYLTKALRAKSEETGRG